MAVLVEKAEITNPAQIAQMTYEGTKTTGFS